MILTRASRADLERAGLCAVDDSTIHCQLSAVGVPMQLSVETDRVFFPRWAVRLREQLSLEDWNSLRPTIERVVAAARRHDDPAALTESVIAIVSHGRASFVFEEVADQVDAYLRSLR